MLVNSLNLCCFCGEATGGGDYVEIELHVEQSQMIQFLGAHREHLQRSLFPGFSLEFDPVDDQPGPSVSR